MTRVKRGVVARKKREKILKNSKGFRGSASNLFRVANQHVLKAFKSNYQQRRYKKRDFRSLWISRINAKIRNTSTKVKNYNHFLNQLKSSSVALNRKVLATLAVKDFFAFNQICHLTRPTI